MLVATETPLGEVASGRGWSITEARLVIDWGSSRNMGTLFAVRFELASGDLLNRVEGSFRNELLTVALDLEKLLGGRCALQVWVWVEAR